MDNTRKNKCNFCELEQPINIIDNMNQYCFSLPLSSKTLVITDKKRKREYLYGINFCPICGKRLT